MKTRLASLLAVPAFLALSTPIRAGGGLISLSSQQLGPQVYLVTAAVQKEDYTPCVNCVTTFFVKDLHSTKYTINPLAPVTDKDGKISAKIALTDNASATVTYYAQSQLPTQLYTSSDAILTFQQGNEVEQIFATPYGTPEPPIGFGQIMATPTSNPAIDQLQDKVNDLQDKLEKSQKKQSFLEAQLTAITNFLKHIFPFWK